MKMNTFLIKKHEDEQKKVRSGQNGKVIKLEQLSGEVGDGLGPGPADLFRYESLSDPSLQNITIALTKPTS